MVEKQEVGTEQLGRFGHHPDAGTDFCVEVEEIESILIDCELGLRNPLTERLGHRSSGAFAFIPCADPIAVAAKQHLRELHDRLLAQIDPNALKRRAGPALYDAAIAARDLLKPVLDEPGRTVFWKLVDAIRRASPAQGQPHD